jgi:hypothetical protein
MWVAPRERERLDASVTLYKMQRILIVRAPPALAGGAFTYKTLFADLEGCDVGDHDVAEFSSTSSTKLVTGAWLGMADHLRCHPGGYAGHETDILLDGL